MPPSIPATQPRKETGPRHTEIHWKEGAKEGGKLAEETSQRTMLAEKVLKLPKRYAT